MEVIIDKEPLSLKDIEEQLLEIHGMLDILYNELRPMWDKLEVLEELQLVCVRRLDSALRAERGRREPPA